MRVTNGDIFMAKTALQELIQEPLPVKTAYWLTKLVRKAQEQLRDVEAVRIKLVKELGAADEAGNYTVPRDSENWQAFESAYNELMSETVEIEGLPMEKITLPSNNGLCVSAATLLALDPFINVEVE